MYESKGYFWILPLELLNVNSMITFIREGRVEKDRGIFGGVDSSDSGVLNEGLRMMGRNVGVLRFAGLGFFEDLTGLKGLRELQSLSLCSTQRE